MNAYLLFPSSSSSSSSCEVAAKKNEPYGESATQKKLIVWITAVWRPLTQMGRRSS